MIDLEKIVGCVEYQILQLLEERVAYSIVGILALLLADCPDNFRDFIHVGSHSTAAGAVLRIEISHSAKVRTSTALEI